MNTVDGFLKRDEEKGWTPAQQLGRDHQQCPDDGLRAALRRLHIVPNTYKAPAQFFFWSLQKFMIFSASTYMVPKYLVIRRDFCTALRMRSKFGIISIILDNPL